jgi:hypothetical protein
MPRPLSTLAIAAALGAAITVVVVAGSARAASVPDMPSAFLRPAVAADRLPDRFETLRSGRGRPSDSRRIATYIDGKHRRWSLYIFKETIRGKQNICVVTLQQSGGGGGCDYSSHFFAPGRDVVASSGRVLAGVAADRVARVVVVGSQGRRHPINLTSDHGFIYNCRAYNGCTCVVARLEAFDKAGKLLTNQSWLGNTCPRHR